MPAAIASAGRGDPERPAAQQDLARVGGVSPKSDARELGPARADEAGEADDLARAHLEVDVRRTPADRLPRSRSSSTTSPRSTARFGNTAVSSRPTISWISSWRLTSAIVAGVDRGAVAQHRDAVGDRRQLLEPVRDVDHPDALRRAGADDAEEVLRVVLGERGRRLVEDQDAGVGPERARDLDELLLAAWSARPASRLRIDPRPDLREQLPRRAAVALSSRRAARSLRALQAEGDVLGHRQVGEQRRLLVDGGDAERAGDAWRVVGDALVRRRITSPASAATAPVTTLMSVDLPAPFSPTSAWTSPLPELEGGGAQRVDAGVGLLHAPGREQDLRHAR